MKSLTLLCLVVLSTICFVGTAQDKAQAQDAFTTLPPHSTEEIFSAITLAHIAELLTEGKIKGLQFGRPVTSIKITERVTGKKMAYEVTTGGGWCRFDVVSYIISGDDRTFVQTRAYPPTCQN